MCRRTVFEIHLYIYLKMIIFCMFLKLIIGNSFKILNISIFRRNDSRIGCSQFLIDIPFLDGSVKSTDLIYKYFKPIYFLFINCQIFVTFLEVWEKFYSALEKWIRILKNWLLNLGIRCFCLINFFIRISFVARIFYMKTNVKLIIKIFVQIYKVKISN